VIGLAIELPLHDDFLIGAHCDEDGGDWAGQTYLILGTLLPQYDLTIDSTDDGDVTTPGEGVFTYDEGTVVGLAAGPHSGYRFDQWTGDVSTIANIYAVSTTITMNGHYSITATFQEVPSEVCFIATAAYGTPVAEQIQVLREFRDEYLLTNPAGEALVGLYYRVSPPVADFISEHPSLKPIIRAALMPAVAMSTIAVNTTPTEKAAIVALVVLVPVVVAMWMIRRRSRDSQYI